MPELPEVEITKLKLAPLLRGRRVLDFWTDWPRGLVIVKGKRKKENNQRWVADDMRGRKILDITRRGKVLFFRLSGKPERTMAIHLRMSGRLAVGTSATASAERRWTHFSWELSGGRELRFVDPRKFGRVWYGRPERLAETPYLASLGIDAADLPAARFLAAFRGRRGMVKPLLLRQDIVAGIGNILADESLWHAGVHPRTSAADLDDRALRRVHGGLRRTIRRALASGGTSMRNFKHPDGRSGRYQEERLAYGNAGKPCPRCRTRLLRIVVGSRGTTLCPKCQRMQSVKS